MNHLSTASRVRPRPAWTRLVRLVLTSYYNAYGPDGAEHRLRRHVPHWPAPARRALARIAREGGAL